MMLVCLLENIRLTIQEVNFAKYERGLKIKQPTDERALTRSNQYSLKACGASDANYNKIKRREKICAIVRMGISGDACW